MVLWNKYVFQSLKGLVVILKANANQAQDWLKKLVKESDDVLNSTGIDGSVLANIIETAAGKIDAGLESPAQPVVDMNVLRFPQLGQPDFKVGFRFPMYHRNSMISANTLFSCII